MSTPPDRPDALSFTVMIAAGRLQPAYMPALWLCSHEVHEQLLRHSETLNRLVASLDERDALAITVRVERDQTGVIGNTAHTLCIDELGGDE